MPFVKDIKPRETLDYWPDHYPVTKMFCSECKDPMTILVGNGMYSAIAWCAKCEQYRYKVGDKWLERK